MHRGLRRFVCRVIGTVFIVRVAAVVEGAENVPAVNLFAFPSPVLRTHTPEPAEPAPVRPALSPEKAAPEPFSLSNAAVADADIELNMQRYSAMNGEPLLREPVYVPEPAGAIGWVQTKVVEPIFTMETVRVKKVFISGSIVTAIKRKNPLALLNPMVIAIDW
jgi:hypothetical protein